MNYCRGGKIGLGGVLFWEAWSPLLTACFVFNTTPDSRRRRRCRPSFCGEEKRRANQRSRGGETATEKLRCEGDPSSARFCFLWLCFVFVLTYSDVRNAFVAQFASVSISIGGGSPRRHTYPYQQRAGYVHEVCMPAAACSTYLQLGLVIRGAPETSHHDPRLGAQLFPLAAHLSRCFFFLILFSLGLHRHRSRLSFDREEPNKQSMRIGRQATQPQHPSFCPRASEQHVLSRYSPD